MIPTTILILSAAVILSTSDAIRIPISNWLKSRIRRPMTTKIVSDTQSVYLGYRSTNAAITINRGLARRTIFTGFAISFSDSDTIFHRVIVEVTNHEFERRRNIIGVLVAEPNDERSASNDISRNYFYYKIAVSRNSYDHINSMFDIVENANKECRSLALDMDINLFSPSGEPVFPSHAEEFQSRGLPIRFVASVTGIEVDEWPRIHRD